MELLIFSTLWTRLYLDDISVSDIMPFACKDIFIDHSDTITSSTSENDWVFHDFWTSLTRVLIKLPLVLVYRNIIYEFILVLTTVFGLVTYRTKVEHVTVGYFVYFSGYSLRWSIGMRTSTSRAFLSCRIFTSSSLSFSRWAILKYSGSFSFSLIAGIFFVKGY